MTLRHIKIFVTVCECNSMTVAGEKLFLAQPAVSLAVSELEDYYGIRLFDRIAKKLYITEQGKRFLNYATHIVSLFNEMEQEVRNYDFAGTLRVGSSITIGNHLLPGFIQLYNTRYPQMKLQVKINNSEEIEKCILNNDIDLALIEGRILFPQTLSEKLMDDRLVMICGRKHPLSGKTQVDVTELNRYDFILREKGSGGRELFDSTMLAHDIEIKPVWESISTQAIIKAVTAGFGLSVLPFLLVKPYLERHEIQEVRIKDIVLKRQFYIIYHKNKYLTHSAREFISICKRTVKSELVHSN